MTKSRGSEAAERRDAYWMIAPAVAVLVGVAVYPILAAIWLNTRLFAAARRVRLR